MGKVQSDFMAYGIDSASAKNLSKMYTVQQLKKQPAESLTSLGISQETADLLSHPTRTPIPSKTVEDVLAKSAFACCICHQHGLPIVIHHLTRWEHSHSHDPDNLAVLCLNHHGEAHSHHENSRNLTPQAIRNAREHWYAIIQKQKIEAERALDTIRRYSGRWDYLNLNYVLGFIDEHKILFDSRYRCDLIAKGLLTENGTICSDKLKENDAYWLHFFDGQYLKRYIEEQLNIIIGCVPVRYIRDSLYMQDKIKPGELLLVDGQFHFKCLNKQTKGIGQTRKVWGIVNHMKFEGEFDAWYCTSSSSHSSHLTGNKYATLLCLARNVEETATFDLVNCTVIGLGLNLTQPDEMVQLFGNAREIPFTDFKSQSDCELELDDIADIRRGQEEKEYYMGAPEVCDICKISFRNQKYMIDGAMKPSRIGACMCPKCYHAYGVGIGWGIGQLYLRENNRWLLVAGFYDCEENWSEADMSEELLLQFLEDLK